MAVRLDPNVTTAAGHKPATVDANDFKQFAALRRSNPDDPKALREVARQFESLFTKMMLESMRSASFGDPMFGSDQTEMYQGMMDDQMAVQLTAGRGIGLADMLFRQLQGGGAGTAAVRPDPAAGKDVARQVSPEQRREFIDQLLPHATAAAQELGVDPRAIVAQAALETGWGRHMPADARGGSNNYFGIKAGGTWRGASMAADTTEFTAGAAATERAHFRAYGSVAENVADYVRVLRDNPRYAAALGTGSDVGAFATALQRGGYATDPDYANKLVSIVSRMDEMPAAGRREIAGSVKPFKPEAQAPIATPRINNA